MKNFYLDLREHVTKITDHEKKEMMSLTKEKKTLHAKSLLYMQKRI